MNRSTDISKRLEEVFLNGLWIANTNYKAQLSILNWEQAVLKIEKLNSIAALTYHINYYLSGILTVFKGGKLEIHDQYSFDVPPITSENEWNQLRESLFENALLFIQYTNRLSDEQLNAVFVDEKYGTYLRNIEGVIEHSYYHLGQIVLIAKLLRAK